MPADAGFDPRRGARACGSTEANPGNRDPLRLPSMPRPAGWLFPRPSQGNDLQDPKRQTIGDDACVQEPPTPPPFGEAGSSSTGEGRSPRPYAGMMAARNGKSNANLPAYGWVVTDAQSRFCAAAYALNAFSFWIKTARTTLESSARPRFKTESGMIPTFLWE